MAKFLDLEGLNYFWEKIKSWVLERFAYKSDLNQKLNILISGQNIKTINGYNITGPGNIEIESGAVDSVNGKTGDVFLSANDVGALPNTTVIPTDISQLINDSGFISTETDPTVPSWAKSESKPTYTANEVSAVPIERTINGKALSSNITLNASDVNALPSSTTIPTKTSDLDNDLNFSSVSIDRKVSTGTNIADITIDGTTTLLFAPQGGGDGEENIIESISVNGTQLTVTNKNVDITVPTKTSDLNNDSGFITGFTETDPTVPSWAKQPNKPSYNYSEIGNTPDLSGFITKSVNDLTNYYLKSETYTKAEVAALIGAIQQFHYEIYASLPQSGQGNVLYLIGPTGSGSDRYEEYVYANNAFTKIGDTSIDLSGYVTTSALNTALAGYATTQDLEDSKVFWAEVDVTTFAEIQDAIDAGRTVMLKDEDGYIYTLQYIEATYATFSCSSGDECFIKTYNVYDDDSWELLYFSDIESRLNMVQSISLSSTTYQYPSAKAVYDIVSTKYTKPQGGIPASDLASGVIPTVPVQDVTVGGTSVVSNGTAVIPQEVFWATYGTTTAAEIDAAVAAGKLVMCNYSNHSYRLEDYRDNQPLYFSCFISSQMRYYLNINRTTNVWSGGTITHENAAVNKVSTIVGNETNTTKYPNTKAVADALADYVQKSQTTGLLKNDGTVDTNTYLTQHQDISGKADKTTVASSMPSGGFLPNVVYNLGTLSGDTTFLMAAATDNTIVNIWCWTFSTGATSPTISWPSGITKWSGSNFPLIDANKTYEITVMNGLATIIES